MRLPKIKMNLVLGEPGSGKSYDLINEVLELEKQGKSVYAFTPTYVSKKRLISGYFDAGATKDLAISAYGDTHVLQNNYRGQQYIFIDEFSMITLDNFRSLLYGCLNSDHKTIYLTCFADIKQLPAVSGASALMYILKTNIEKFKKNLDVNFWFYIQNNFYNCLNDMSLNIPQSWELAVKSIDLNVKHQNYRLQNKNLSSYNTDFYADVLNNQTLTKDDYSKELLDRYKQGCLIVVPTHEIGREVDNILARQLITPTENISYNTKEIFKVAPLIRVETKVYQNPECIREPYKHDENKFEDFILQADSNVNLKAGRPTFYVTTHSVQSATVDNVVFYLGNHTIPSDARKNFYNNNLLYTALSRAKFHSEFFGKPSEFKKMINIYPEDGHKILLNDLNKQALKQTYNTVIATTEKHGIYSDQQIINLFHENFKKVCSQNESQINEQKVINDFDLKPLSDNQIMKVLDLDETKPNQFTNDLQRLGYVFHYFQWQKKQLKTGGKKGGVKGGRSTNGKVKKWLDSLSENKLKQIKADLSLSVRQFKAKYHMTKKNVQKYFEVRV